VVTTAGSSFDTLLAIYTGTTVSNLTLVAANDDDHGSDLATSRVEFPTMAGAAYRIAVDGYLGAEGIIELSLRIQGVSGFHLAAPRWEPGWIELRLTGDVGQSYVIEASSDNRSWHSMGLETAIDGVAVVLDADASNYQERFYRAREFNQDRGVLVQGMVQNARDGSPVPGAVVFSSLDVQTAFTDWQGRFTWASLVEGDYSNVPYTIMVTAQGFQPFMETAVFGQLARDQILLLEPVE
jgi:hypothetical protein